MHNYEEKLSERQYMLILISISMALFMASLDGTIVNIALPTISHIFDLPTTTVAWVATIYLLTLTGCFLIFGKLADRIGFRRIFISGFFIFTIGSFFCGFLPEFLDSFLALLGSRVLQAVGGAMIAAMAPAMVAAFFPLNRKGKAMGIITIFAALGTAIGPIVGGFLTQYLSWNWIFYINIPVGILAILLGMYAIPYKPPATTSHSPFDYPGAVLVFSGLGFLILAVSIGASVGWTSPVVLGAFAVSLLSLCILASHELKTADPILDFRLFKKRNFVLTNLILVITFFLFGGVNYLMPFFLTIVKNLDPSTAGLILASLSVALMISGFLSGRLINRIGNRRCCIIGSLFLSAGYLMIAFFSSDISIHYIIIALGMVGLGLGLVYPPGTNMVMWMAARDKHGMVSSLLNVERSAPLTLGIAFFSMLFVQAMLFVAQHREITEASPAALQIQVVVAGFDLVFVLIFFISILVVLLSFLSKDEIHPDNLDDTAESMVVV
ncbi:EmrB/QacA subfamily drug resistance transporter [Methanocalculus sp. AMF5]|uniref:MFS transporter n=1 Tax=Methanocalculus sp. AMF5 TaxID=1198257 RepID=UPI0020A1467F|nr:MFS transporter [Methanocalculus sp. AMF5]MCP1662453.1 EmrB/QacA subfamily drug resistance transporter [Methanocalculus sp. AMF5]